MTGSFPHHHSALALAAVSAGPGSDLQQQLFSLLCTMVKLGSTPVANTLPEDAGKGAHQARAWLRDGAALTAAALLADAACGHLHHPHQGGDPLCRSFHAALSIHLGPLLYVVGA